MPLVIVPLARCQSGELPLVCFVTGAQEDVDLFPVEFDNVLLGAVPGLAARIAGTQPVGLQLPFTLEGFSKQSRALELLLIGIGLFFGIGLAGGLVGKLAGRFWGEEVGGWIGIGLATPGLLALGWGVLEFLTGPRVRLLRVQGDDAHLSIPSIEAARLLSDAFPRPHAVSV